LEDSIAKDRLPAPEQFDLKCGARILMVKNDRENRCAHGSFGTISSLSESAIWFTMTDVQ
jgi:hypothetical protein